MSETPDALPRSRHTTIVVGATMAVLAFVAWRVLTLGLADHLAERNSDAALIWRGAHPEALLASTDGVQGEELMALGRRAVAAAPLEGEGYRRLAEAAAAAGDGGHALALYRIAARLSPRDRAAQAWLVDHFLQQGDVPSALMHLDPLLRVEPTFVQGAMPVLVALAESPAAQDEFVSRLATAPPWRRAVLRGLPTAVTDMDAMSAFYVRLARAGGLGPGDLDPWIEKLGRAGRWGDAYLAWVGQLPPERREGIGNVADGGFEWPADQGGFGWRYGRVAGARIERLREAPAGADHALRISFQHQRVAFNHLRQLLALPPGRWRLDGQVRLVDLRTERGLVWRVVCAPPNRSILAETPPLRGRSDWREFAVEFVVPEAGCGGQWLELRLPARIEAEQRIGGQVWFDDLRISRVS